MGPSRTRNVGIQRPRNQPRAATPLNCAGTERQSALALIASDVNSICAALLLQTDFRRGRRPRRSEQMAEPSKRGIHPRDPSEVSRRMTKVTWGPENRGLGKHSGVESHDLKVRSDQSHGSPSTAPSRGDPLERARASRGLRLRDSSQFTDGDPERGEDLRHP